MARSDPLADVNIITSFGKNVFACCELTGSNIESLAIRVEIHSSILTDYKLGKRHLTEEHIDAVCAEFMLTTPQLVHEYGSDENRKQQLGKLLAANGYITGTLKSDEDACFTNFRAPAKSIIEPVNVEAPQVLEAPTVIETPVVEESPISAGKEPVVEEEMDDPITAESAGTGTMVWNEEDLLGTASSGEEFNLLDSRLRGTLVRRIRGIVKDANDSLQGLSRRTGLDLPSSWWVGVEKGKRRIFGAQLEAISKSLDVSVYRLLTGSDAHAPPSSATSDVEPTITEVAAEPNPPEVQAESTGPSDPAAGASAPAEADEHALTWDEDDLTARTAAGEKFYIASKPVRQAIIERIRIALSSSDESFSAMLKRAKLDKVSSWGRGVELGQCRIYGGELEMIAEALKVAPYALLSGIGLTPQPPEAKQAPEPEIVPVEPTVITPATDQKQEYFRCLLLSSDTEPAPGVRFGQLLELARNQESVDWVSSYLTLTLAGTQLAASIAEMRKSIAAHDEPVRDLFLHALTEAYE